MKDLFCIICGGNLTENGAEYECDTCKKSFPRHLVDELYVKALHGSKRLEEDLPTVAKDVIKTLLEGGAEGVSISVIQRRFGCGFPKAARIFDWVVEEGLVELTASGKLKNFKITLEEFNQKYGE